MFAGTNPQGWSSISLATSGTPRQSLTYKPPYPSQDTGGGGERKYTPYDTKLPGMADISSQDQTYLDIISL